MKRGVSEKERWGEKKVKSQKVLLDFGNLSWKEPSCKVPSL